MSTAAPTAARAIPGGVAVAFALASVYILWGSTYLAIRFALESYPPFLLGAVRMFLAGAIMYAVLRWRGVKPPTGKQWRTLWVLSIWMVLLSNGLVNLAETEVGSGLAAIAVASMPLFAGVFAMLRGRHPSKIEWVGLVIGFLGVLWLNAGSELSSSMLGLICLVDRADRLGMGIDLEPRPGPAAALHVGRRRRCWPAACGCCWRRACTVSASPRCRRWARPRPCSTWSWPARSSASPPTSGCCTTCARPWRPATPTSIRRSRCCSAHCSGVSASPRTTSARWR